MRTPKNQHISPLTNNRLNNLAHYLLGLRRILCVTLNRLDKTLPDGLYHIYTLSIFGKRRKKLLAFQTTLGGNNAHNSATSSLAGWLNSRL